MKYCFLKYFFCSSIVVAGPTSHDTTLCLQQDFQMAEFGNYFLLSREVGWIYELFLVFHVRFWYDHRVLPFLPVDCVPWISCEVTRLSQWLGNDSNHRFLEETGGDSQLAWIVFKLCWSYDLNMLWVLNCRTNSYSFVWWW